ncbi:UDP-4-amino-4,6-dideoxy-N-acetyl-beta-L-altrosamine transaminase [Ekhidna sp.]
MSRKIIPYGRQNITDEDVNAVIDALNSDFLTQGPRIAEFENAFASYVNSKYAVAVANGTAALHLSALALGLEKGKKVITSPISFAASANCVLYAGGSPIFADINRETYVLSIESCEEIIKKEGKENIQGIIPVDYAGLPVDMEAFRELADKYDLWLIEDACHAPGGSYPSTKGRSKCGSGDFADLSIFSFHPVKHIASGEGGMITTNNEELYKKLTTLRTHGITKNPDEMEANHGGWYYEMHNLGYNYRLTDLQSALGLSQLNKAADGLSKRRRIARKYRDQLGHLPIKFQHTPDGFEHAYHLFTIEVEDRKALYDHLHAHGILAQVHYIPIHTLPYYRGLGFEIGDFPNAEDYYSKCLSLPMFPTLSEEEQNFVINKVTEFFE